MPDYWQDVTLTYSAEDDSWTGVIVPSLVQFTGTLFSVLNQLDEYLNDEQ